jgi:hypothetical protein
LEIRRGRALARWRKLAIFAVKLVHSAIFLSVAASVVYVCYAGLANRSSRLTKVALGTALAESLVFTVNRFHCPLRALAEDLGAESGQVTDIFLPRWFADRIPLFFTPPLLIGVVAMVWNRWRRGTPAGGTTTVDLALTFPNLPGNLVGLAWKKRTTSHP